MIKAFKTMVVNLFYTGTPFWTC